MENKFSEGLERVLQYSRNEANRLNSEFLNTEHFLLGIIGTDNSARDILEILKADLVQIRRKIENMSVGGHFPMGLDKNIGITKMADQALKRAQLESRQYRSENVNTIHLLLGILYKIDDPTANILEAYDVDYESVVAEYRAMLKDNGQLPKVIGGGKR